MTTSPLDPTTEVRFVGHRELSTLLDVLVIPGAYEVDGWKKALADHEVSTAIRKNFGVRVDTFRIQLALRERGLMRSGSFFDARIAQSISAHDRLRVTRARSEDEAAKA